MEREQRANDIKNFFYFCQRPFFLTFGQLAYIIPSFHAQRLKQWQKEGNKVWIGELAIAYILHCAVHWPGTLINTLYVLMQVNIYLIKDSSHKEDSIITPILQIRTLRQWTIQ